MVQHIGDQIEGMTFEAWEADDRYTGQRWSKRVFENAFGLNPLEAASFLFRPSDKKPVPFEWLLDVKHTGDTCYWSDDYEADSLLPAEKAQSEIGLFGFLIVGGSSENWYDVWSNCKYPGDEPASDKDVAGQRVWQGSAAGCNVWGFGRTWSVADFATEAEVRKRVQEFQTELDQLLIAARR
jgi:hypothetical protein